MKLIESNVEYIPQAEGLEGIYRQIELAGRTAYKSEDKITEGSAKKFVDMLIRNKHNAALEHSTVYLKRKGDVTDVRNEIFIDFYRRNPYSRVVFSNGIYYITTNLRVLQENNCLDDLKYICEHTKNHEKRYTFKFTCDRGISHELVRHRAFSPLQESTRFCNYMMDKFGNEITCIIPSWTNLIAGNSYNTEIAEICNRTEGISLIDQRFLVSVCAAEHQYMQMLKEGLTPQQARAVLPNALKTELVMTGFSSDWRNLLDLRYFEKTGPVHPDMKVLMQKLSSLMHVTGVWDNVMKYPSKFD